MHTKTSSASLSPRDLDSIASYQEIDDDKRYARVKFSTFKRLFLYTLAYKQHLMLGSIALIVTAFASLVPPWLVGYYVEHGLMAHNKDFIIPCAIALFVTEIVRLFANYFENYYFFNLGQKTIHDLRKSLFLHTLRLPISKINQLSSGNFTARILGDTSALAQVFSSGIVRSIERFIVVVLIIISLFLVDVRLAIFCLAPLPIALIVGIFVSFMIYKRQVRSRMAATGVGAFFNESLDGLPIIHHFSLSNIFKERFAFLNHLLVAAQVSPTNLSGFFHALMTVLTAVGMSLLLVFGGELVVKGEAKLGDLITCATYLIWIFWPIIHLVNQWTVLVSAAVSAERIFEYLDWEPEVENITGEQTFKKEISGHIKFENVWFAYNKDNWVIQDLSFELKPGESLAVVGPTGAGKSTIMSLLLRFYEPTKGAIFLDGKPLSEWNLEELRTVIGIVEQEGAFWSGTVEENVALLGRSEAATSLAFDFLSKQSPGLSKREINQSANNLSSGEKQLVAFARVLAREPAIWVLDEATAHLDPKLDRELNSFASKYAKGKSLLIVAHRLSSVVNCDRIMVLAEGKIAQYGSHQELLHIPGLYQQLLAAQELE